MIGFKKKKINKIGEFITLVFLPNYKSGYKSRNFLLLPPSKQRKKSISLVKRPITV